MYIYTVLVNILFCFDELSLIETVLVRVACSIGIGLLDTSDYPNSKFWIK